MSAVEPEVPSGNPFENAAARDVFRGAVGGLFKTLLVCALGAATVLLAGWLAHWAGLAVFAVVFLLLTGMLARHLNTGAHAFWAVLTLFLSRGRDWSSEAKWTAAAYVVSLLGVFAYVACVVSLYFHFFG